MPAARQSIYVETSVVSYLVAKPSRDRLIAARQEMTKDWWKIRDRYFLMISTEVRREAVRGDATYAARREEALSKISVLPLTDTIVSAANALLKAGALPPIAQSDAVHVAFASAYSVDILLTWNLRHLANPNCMKKVREIITMLGMRMPESVRRKSCLLLENKMYEDEILRELWKVKDELSKEYARDPAAYWAELRRLEGNSSLKPPPVARKNCAARREKLSKGQRVHIVSTIEIDGKKGRARRSKFVPCWCRLSHTTVGQEMVACGLHLVRCHETARNHGGPDAGSSF